MVEDDPLNLMVIEKLLSMSGVTSIDVARNGAEVPRCVALYYGIAGIEWVLNDGEETQANRCGMQLL